MKRHIELNPPSSSFTATATYYFGPARWDITKNDAFLSISDCYDTIRLHPNTDYFDDKELQAYKKKLTKLRDFIDDFISKLPDKLQGTS